MNRARASLVLLSILLWHLAAPAFLAFVATPIAQATVIAPGQDEGNSTWVPNATGTSELLQAIRGSQLRLRLARRPADSFEQFAPAEQPQRIMKRHRSPYPTRQQLHLRLSRSESGELPH